MKKLLSLIGGLLLLAGCSTEASGLNEVSQNHQPIAQASGAVSKEVNQEVFSLDDASLASPMAMSLAKDQSASSDYQLIDFDQSSLDENASNNLFAQALEMTKGASISNLEVVPVNSNSVDISYDVTNTSDQTLSRYSYLAVYKANFERGNLLQTIYIGQDVPANSTKRISNRVSRTAIATQPVAIRLFDYNNNFPNLSNNNSMTDENLADNALVQAVDGNIGASISNLEVVPVNSNSVDISYDVVNTSNQPISRNSYLAVYKENFERGNLLQTIYIGQDVPGNSTKRITNRVSRTAISTQPVAIRLFDYNNSFPNLNNNMIIDGNLDDNSLVQKVDKNVGASISNLEVVPVNSNSVDISYDVVNTSNQPISRNSYLAVYKENFERGNLLQTIYIGQDVPANSTKRITNRVSRTAIATQPVAIRLFDYNNSFPNLNNNMIIDGNLDDNSLVQKVDKNVGASISNLEVVPVNSNSVDISYDVVNTSNQPISRNSYLAVYKANFERGNLLQTIYIGQDVPANSTKRITNRVSRTAIATQPVAIRLFDYNNSFPNLNNNMIIDGNLDDNSLVQKVDKNVGVSISKLSVERINDNSVTVTFDITNNTSVDLSNSTYLSAYKNDISRSNLLNTFTLGEVVKSNTTKTIKRVINATEIAMNPVTIRLSDYNNNFPYTNNNSFIDGDLEDNVVTAKAYKYKLSAIGDSLTHGYATPGVNSYPGQLQTKLGNDFAVKNYGVSGRTASKSGDAPYVNERYYTESLNSNADIFTIMLGANDTKPWNWYNRGVENKIEEDYRALIKSYQSLENNPKIYILIAPPMLVEEIYGINETRYQTVRAMSQRLADELGVETIYLYDVFDDYSSRNAFYTDGVHISRSGYDLISDKIQAEIEKDFN